MKPFTTQQVLIVTLGLLIWIVTVFLALRVPDYDKAIVFTGIVIDLLLAMYYARL
ncbi:MAG: hypothetical protein H7Z72_16270 [Bacteroidetes bacterium]|nr:hypothetical protein [Fibrella sp.]